MRRKNLFKAGGIAGFLLFAFSGRAQYSVSAPLEKVMYAGIYRIVLPPAFVARCKGDLADVRIFGPGGTAVPYVLNADVKNPLNAGYSFLPDPVIRQTDSSDKYSYVHLSFEESYRIERLSLVVSGPTLYKREVEVYDDDYPSSWTAMVTSFTIDPQDSVFKIPAVKTKHLRLEIRNRDNVPLKLSKVAASQSGIYLLAQLEESKSYTLKAGDSLAARPEYDLHFFTDSMRSKPLDAVIGQIAFGAASKKEPITVSNEGSVKKGGSSFLLWSVLSFVLLLLIYISVKMVKSIAKKESDDRL